MAYVKTLYDFGGNKYDIKDAAAMKDVDLVGSDLSFYDGDNNLIKKVTLSGGAQKWNATFTQQYVDTIKRSMALTPRGFTIDDVKVGDIIIASDTNQYTDLPTGWFINWNQGGQSQVGILVVDNVPELNLYYPLGSEYEYMFIVNYVDKLNNRVLLHMIPCAYKNELELCMPTTKAMFDSAPLALAPLAKYAPYYLVESGKDVMGICVEDSGTSFTDFAYQTNAVTMLFTDGKYAQHLDFGFASYNLLKRKVYIPTISDGGGTDTSFLGMPEYIYYLPNKVRLVRPLYPAGIIEGPKVKNPSDPSQEWVTKYEVLETLVPNKLVQAQACILTGQWY